MYEGGQIYSAEDAIFDEDLYTSLQSSTVPIHSINPRKALITLFSQRQSGSQTCYLHYLSKQLIREVIKYLPFPDFFAFTGTCRRYLVFLSDPYTNQTFPSDTQTGYLFKSPTSRKDIQESLIKSRLEQGKMSLQPYIFVRNKRMRVLHVEVSGGEAVVYSLQDAVVWVWRLEERGTEDIGMLLGLDPCTSHAGFSDTLFLANSLQIRLSSRHPLPDLTYLPDLDSYTLLKTWDLPCIVHSKWCRNGETLIAASKNSVFILDQSLNLVSTVEFIANIDFIYVENVKNWVFLVYSSPIISIFNLKKSQTVPVTTLQVPYAVAIRTFVVALPNHTHKDFIFTLTSQGHVYSHQSTRISLSQISEMHLLHEFLCLLTIHRDQLEIYKPGTSFHIVKKCTFSPPLFSNIALTQEKMIAICSAMGEFGVGMFKYDSKTPFYSLPLSVSQVLSLKLYGTLLLLEAISQNNEFCLIAVNITRIKSKAMVGDYNLPLQRKEIEVIRYDLTEETVVKRKNIEDKRSKKNKNRRNLMI